MHGFVALDEVSADTLRTSRNTEADVDEVSDERKAIGRYRTTSSAFSAPTQHYNTTYILDYVSYNFDLCSVRDGD